MKQIFLMRHAEAISSIGGLEDFERPLSDKGCQIADMMGRYISTLNICPSYVACSSALRTKQTWEIIAPYLSSSPLPMMYEKGLYLTSSLALSFRIRELNNRAASVLIIGHNPGLEELAWNMSGPESAREDVMALSQGMPPASFACILSDANFWRDLHHAPSKLLGFVRPQDVQNALGRDNQYINIIPKEETTEVKTSDQKGTMQDNIEIIENLEENLK